MKHLHKIKETNTTFSLPKYLLKYLSPKRFFSETQETLNKHTFRLLFSLEINVHAYHHHQRQTQTSHFCVCDQTKNTPKNFCLEITYNIMNSSPQILLTFAVYLSRRDLNHFDRKLYLKSFTRKRCPLSALLEV